MEGYKAVSIYFDTGKPDEAWAYQYLMSLRHGKKAVVITALKMMLGKGGQTIPVAVETVQPMRQKKKTVVGKKINSQRTHTAIAQSADNETKAISAETGRTTKENETDNQGGTVDKTVEETIQNTFRWEDYFSAEQVMAIHEKDIDMSQLTEDGIRQMAKQVQGGIPVRAAYREALMWCQ